MPYVNSTGANAPLLIMVALATSLSAPLSSAVPRLCERWSLITLGGLEHRHSSGVSSI
jgi:hypothetical protein